MAHDDRLAAIESRLSNLERSRRVWKLIACCLALLVVSSAGLGAAAAVKLAKLVEAEEVKARKFTLVGEDGKTRGGWAAYQKGSVFDMYQPDGFKKGISLETSGIASTVAVFHPGKPTRCYATLHASGGILGVCSEWRLHLFDYNVGQTVFVAIT